MGNDTDRVPRMYGPYNTELWSFFAKRMLDEGPPDPISAAAFDHLGGVKRARALAYFCQTARGHGKSFLQRPGNTRMNLKEQIAVMQHFDNGGKVQFWHASSGQWADVTAIPSWNWGVTDYRIKPEARKLFLVEYTNPGDSDWKRVCVMRTPALAEEAVRRCLGTAHALRYGRGRREYRIVEFMEKMP